MECCSVINKIYLIREWFSNFTIIEKKQTIKRDNFVRREFKSVFSVVFLVNSNRWMNVPIETVLYLLSIGCEYNRTLKFLECQFATKTFVNSFNGNSSPDGFQINHFLSINLKWFYSTKQIERHFNSILESFYVFQMNLKLLSIFPFKFH